MASGDGGSDNKDHLVYSYQPVAPCIDFKVGFPDPNHLPIQEVTDAFQEMFARMQKRPDFFQYCTFAGYASVRKELGTFLARLYGLNDAVHEDQLVICAGVSGGLDLILTLCGVDRTRIVYCEEHTFFAARMMLADRRCDVRKIPFEQNGHLNLDWLECKLKSDPEEAQRTALVYVVPTFNNPTGVTLSESLRRRLIELAHQFNFLIASDEVYNSLGFPETKKDIPPSMALLDDKESGRTFSLGSFSKVLCPALRFGWIHASTNLCRKLSSSAVLVSGSCPSHLSSGAVEILLQSRKIDEIVKSASSLLATKASVMFDTLQKHLPEGCFVGAFKDQTLRKPQGGFFLVVTLPEKVSATKLRDKAKNELDLVIFPGIESGDSLDNKFRLCFAYHSVEEIKAGVEKLCNCIQSFINSQNFQLS